MDDVWIVNASPLILLARIERLDLLLGLAKRVSVPSSVLSELEVGNDRDRAHEKVTSVPGLEEVPDLDLPERIRLWDLGPGESQVIAHAQTRRGSEVILDDKAARACAKALGIRCTGTLGVILRSKQAGLVPNARPLLEALTAEGIRLSPKLLESALKLVGE